MRTVIRTLWLAFFWMVFLGFALPYLDDALYALRLSSMRVPVALHMPVRGVTTGAVRDSWHAPRSGGRRHEGIDIFAARGTPVQAATEGIVIRRQQTTLGGNVVWVLGPGGQRHYYAHLDRFAHVSQGQRVQAGTILGYVGATGNARGTPPHLHYGIYGSAGAINPYPTLVPIQP